MWFDHIKTSPVQIRQEGGRGGINYCFHKNQPQVWDFRPASPLSWLNEQGINSALPISPIILFVLLFLLTSTNGTGWTRFPNPETLVKQAWWSQPSCLSQVWAQILDVSLPTSVLNRLPVCIIGREWHYYPMSTWRTKQVGLMEITAIGEGIIMVRTLFLLLQLVDEFAVWLYKTSWWK